jgi:hypothetical protein
VSGARPIYAVHPPAGRAITSINASDAFDPIAIGKKYRQAGCFT